MRVVLQRVKWAEVRVEGEAVAGIGTGILLLAGFSSGVDREFSSSRQWSKLVAKLPDLRIFPDSQGRSNLSLRDVEGEILAVPQFTLYADCRKGRRPSFVEAADPEIATGLFQDLVQELKEMCPGRVGQGSFGAEMELSLCNWGPFTLCLDSRDFQ